MNEQNEMDDIKPILIHVVDRVNQKVIDHFIQK